MLTVSSYEFDLEIQQIYSADAVWPRASTAQPWAMFFKWKTSQIDQKIKMIQQHDTESDCNKFR